MTKRVLISAPYMQPVIGRFVSRLEAHGIQLVVPRVEERLSEAELLGLVGDVDGVICGDDAFTEQVLAAAPRLKVISKWGTGIDSIDKQAAERLGIAVYRTPNAFTIPVRDSVFGYLLCFARNLFRMDVEMRGGRWVKIPSRSLSECVLGIIGVGDIGKAVARRAAEFGMTVLGHDLVELPAAFVEETGIRVCSKREVLEGADFVTLHTDLNPTSHHLISTPELTLMKDSAVLVNTSRGPVVDEQALVWALEEGVIGGAALDVFEDEPLPGDSRLRGLPNVMLAPHNSNSSPEAWERVHENTIRNLLRGLGERR